jgi:hypothetical protein
MIDRTQRLRLILLVSLVAGCLPVIGCAQQAPPLAGKISTFIPVELPEDDAPVPFKTVSERTRTECRLVKEPAYQSKEPRYCLLVLGPEAAERMWLVLDGNTLFIDRNGNGDITEPDEQVKAESFTDNGGHFRVDFPGANGKPKHRLEVFLQIPSHFEQVKDSPFVAILDLAWTRRRNFGAWGDETGPLVFARCPQDAPVIHMGGPLRMGFECRRPLIKKAKDTYELSVGVGTKGIGKGSFAHLKYWRGDIPEDVHPTAVLEFPNKIAGGPPVRIETVLKERCSSCRFQDTVSVPDAEIGKGKVRVKLSFASWKDGKVEDATLEVPIVDLSDKYKE